jgi:hypothetical protein
MSERTRGRAGSTSTEEVYVEPRVRIPTDWRWDSARRLSTKPNASCDRERSGGRGYRRAATRFRFEFAPVVKLVDETRYAPECFADALGKPG